MPGTLTVPLTEPGFILLTYASHTIPDIDQSHPMSPNSNCQSVLPYCRRQSGISDQIDKRQLRVLSESEIQVQT